MEDASTAYQRPKSRSEVYRDADGEWRWRLRGTDGADVIAETEYGIRYPSICARGPVAGVQFHPEKSQTAGLRLLANFAGLATAG